MKSKQVLLCPQCQQVCSPSDSVLINGKLFHTECLEKRKFKTNSFYKIAMEMLSRPTDDNETRCIDRTELFWKELEAHITNGEIIIINISAKMRLGKSTLGMALGLHIFKPMFYLYFDEKSIQYDTCNLYNEDFITYEGKYIKCVGNDSEFHYRKPIRDDLIPRLVKESIK